MSKKKMMKSMDGNMAAAHVAYAFTEVATIYPITPSSPMPEYVDEWAAHGLKNIFGEKVRVAEMQSEAGAAAAMHGALQAGTLATTFTASQGLLLMIPNMYKMSGELLPGVMHVTARSISTHALSIFGDQADVYAVRQTGFAILASGGVQEVMDLGSVAHLAAIKSRVPFLHFFDGFRTSHEIQKIEVLDYQDLKKLADWASIEEFRKRALSPVNPVTRGTAQNPDIYFQLREAANPYYQAVPDIVEGYLKDMSVLTGREYHPFVYYGAPDAEHIIVAMGSVTETIRETIDHMLDKGEKVGLMVVHLYRPFSAKHFFKMLPKSVKRIAVLDRTKEPGANGEPLYLDVRDIFYGRKDMPLIVGGRYGLSSKDTTPGQIIAVYDNLKQPEPKNGFTIGITDDVTFTSLPVKENFSTAPKGTFAAKFYGIGSDGTVGANKNSLKIIGDHTEMYAQAYFAYDAKKSGGVTVSHLRFGKKPIRSTYLVIRPDFVACHVPAYLDQYDMLKGLKKGGTFLLNSIWDAEETKRRLPDHMKKYLAENDISFYIINATEIAEEIGLGTRTNSIMQAAFFKLADVIAYGEAMVFMKGAVDATYGKKGDDIIRMNYAAIEKGAGGLVRIDVPAEWKEIVIDADGARGEVPEFVREIADPMNRLDGDSLPVSAFSDMPDGTFPPGTTAYEKRGVAVHVPEWQPDECIQCNQCSYVCPHAVIRPFLLDADEAAAVPEGTRLVDAKGKGLDGLKFRIQISPLDCTGCGNCEQTCPAKPKALIMKNLDEQMEENARWVHISRNVTYKDNLIAKNTVKGSQFARPLFEYSGACAGCGETPYIKLITQLYGDRMMIANATGCSSIYGGSAPSTPYCINSDGHGPSWASSLFEDSAEFGYGMKVGVEQLRDRIEECARELISGGASPALKEALNEWVEGRGDSMKSNAASMKLVPLLEPEKDENAREILRLKDYLPRRSIWIFGGDGWAYDIGYGGVDHVLATGADVNLLVLDTEVYSNTGGQSSKATPMAAVAKFAAAGKRIRKKDLGMMAITYGYVYVAQVAMGASQAQFLRVVQEAEAYPGPSLIIAYSPCINHGLRAGMGKSQLEEKLAVECGYWHLFHYNPLLEKEGKNPFVLDSKEPDWTRFRDFLMGEVRYTSLKKEFPDIADELFRAAEENAMWRYNSYRRLASLEY
ncbi:MAG: pyruvate:ferredoxin (flavodoxin) oxidoreductase [Spirochaetes bacterium]|nr:pyruvate:ferredoxin (flavodoxin) oxidoreductase [Spirochaetota bacterium]